VLCLCAMFLLVAFVFTLSGVILTIPGVARVGGYVLVKCRRDMTWRIVLHFHLVLACMIGYLGQ
jgi:hypothetical protein